MLTILSKCMIVALLLLFISACERRTRVRLEGGNTPTFVLSGSGVLTGVVIYGPETGKSRSPGDRDNVLWEIQEVNMRGELVEKLRSITYGILPDGYRQVIPETGQPSLLIPGKRYKYWIVTGEAPGAIGYLEIRDGAAVEVEGPE